MTKNAGNYRRINILICLLCALSIPAAVYKAYDPLKQKVLERVTYQFVDCLSDYVDQTGQCRESKIKRFLDVIGLDRRYIESRADLSGLVGFAYAQTGRLSRAKEQYAFALNLWPDFFWFHYNLGLIYYREGNYPKSLESFNKNNHFTVGDNRMFRSETDTINYTAVCNFNDPSSCERFNKIFQILSQNSIAIN